MNVLNRSEYEFIGFITKGALVRCLRKNVEHTYNLINIIKEYKRVL